MQYVRVLTAREKENASSGDNHEALTIARNGLFPIIVFIAVAFLAQMAYYSLFTARI